MKKNERMTVRLSASDMRSLAAIKNSGEFSEMSDAVRWCIHFTGAMLRVIPKAIAESFMEADSDNVDVNECDPVESPNPRRAIGCNV